MNRIIAGILLVLLMATSAHAGKVYFGTSGGATWLDEQELENTFGDTLDLDSDTGFNVGAEVGYIAGPMRYALEYTFRKNNFDEISDNTESLNSGGDAMAHSYMASAYYTISNKTKLSPYLGGGVGVANVSLNNVRVDAVPFDLIDDSDTVFAYKGEIGAVYEVAPNVGFSMAYEYFATAELDMNTTPITGGGEFDTDYDTHNFKVGLMYAF